MLEVHQERFHSERTQFEQQTVDFRKHDQAHAYQDAILTILELRQVQPLLRFLVL